MTLEPLRTRKKKGDVAAAYMPQPLGEARVRVKSVGGKSIVAKAS
jgi:hypothetical protein